MRLSKTRNRIQYLIDIGLNPDDLTSWVAKWTTFKMNVAQKGYRCLLSFEQYMDKAKSAGLSYPYEIGVGSDQYNVCKQGDVPGDYTVDNCDFKTHKENMQDRVVNGGAKSQADRISGRTKYTHGHVASQAEKLSKRFMITDPNGNTHFGSNLTQFCRDHELDQSTMAAVCRGKAKKHKGWTGEYL